MIRVRAYTRIRVRVLFSKFYQQSYLNSGGVGTSNILHLMNYQCGELSQVTFASNDVKFAKAHKVIHITTS